MISLFKCGQMELEEFVKLQGDIQICIIHHEVSMKRAWVKAMFAWSAGCPYMSRFLSFPSIQSQKNDLITVLCAITGTVGPVLPSEYCMFSSIVFYAFFMHSLTLQSPISKRIMRECRLIHCSKFSMKIRLLDQVIGHFKHKINHYHNCLCIAGGELTPSVLL